MMSPINVPFVATAFVCAHASATAVDIVIQCNGNVMQWYQRKLDHLGGRWPDSWQRWWKLRSL